MVPSPRQSGEGGSIRVTGSTASLIPVYDITGYTAARHALVGMVKYLAVDLADDWIQVDLVCSTNVPTPLMRNDANLSRVVPGKENPTYEDTDFPLTPVNLLPLARVERRVISDTTLFLAADTGRCITTATIPVDAGMASQSPGITTFFGRRLAELAQAAGTSVAPTVR